jgi:hypothetical protein
MPVFNQGSANPAALVTPDVYVNVQTPPAAPAQGLATNELGIVGVGSWGPVNSANLMSAAQALALFGGVSNRAHDLCTHISIAAQQGAQIFAPVRVTDGTDLAATGNLGGTTCLTLTGKYTGSLGNKLQAVLVPGSAANSYKITLSLPGQVPETFDNILGMGNAFWLAAAAAINNGQSVSRGPSQLVVASAGAGTTGPAAASVTLTGGTDGAAVTYTQLLGADGLGSARTGMYALRGIGCAIAMLAECATPSTWSAQTAFALSENLEMVDSSAAGGTPSSFATDMTTGGVDSPWFKAMVGDWVYWIDGTNNVTRLVSPQAFYAGGKVAQLPSQSMLNKPVYGCAGTQKSSANQTYSAGDLATVAAARGDLICNPCPGGQYFGVRFGRNTSSDPGRHQDAYTTMTDFLATTLDAAGGQFVGQVMTPDEADQAQANISAFLQNLATPPAGPAQIGAFSVTINSNNASGVQTAAVMVQYLGIVEYFVIDLTGGQTVQIGQQAAQQALAA